MSMMEKKIAEILEGLCIEHGFGGVMYFTPEECEQIADYLVEHGVKTMNDNITIRNYLRVTDDEQTVRITEISTENTITGTKKPLNMMLSDKVLDSIILSIDYDNGFPRIMYRYSV